MIVVGSCYFLLTLLIPYDPNIDFVFPLTYNIYIKNWRITKVGRAHGDPHVRLCFFTLSDDVYYTIKNWVD